MVKVAAFPPSEDVPPPMDGAAGSKRNIPKDHPYEPKALKPLAKALWAASVSMGHALTAYRYLSRLKSATISPDGMLGGRGYVMQVADVRKRLYEACESLSAITDTLHDEVSAPHWKPRLALLDENEAEDVERFIEESQGIMENPEEDAEEEAEEIEQENDKGSEPVPPKNESASEVPNGGGLSAEHQEKSNPLMKQANSSLPVGVIPGGPRIEHLDRGEEDPNPSDAYPNDGWGTPSEREYDYPSEWDNDLSFTAGRTAESGMPIDRTPTEAWDFGLGYGARGEGAGGYENPSGEGDGSKGVWGPASGLPGAPAGSSGDTTPALDSAVGDKHSQGLLPGDGDRPVARSDYYPGDRGNLVNTQAILPGDSSSAGGEMAPGLMNVDYTHEDLSTPYLRYDYTNHNYTGMNDD